jgi:hypothetical protein
VGLDQQTVQNKQRNDLVSAIFQSENLQEQERKMTGHTKDAD